MKMTKEVLIHVEQERLNQIAKYGDDQDIKDLFIALVEEVGEVSQCLQAGQKWAKLSDNTDLLGELIQVAALSVKMAEKVIRTQREEGIK